MENRKQIVVQDPKFCPGYSQGQCQHCSHCPGRQALGLAYAPAVVKAWLPESPNVLAKHYTLFTCPISVLIKSALQFSTTRDHSKTLASLNKMHAYYQVHTRYMTCSFREPATFPPIFLFPIKIFSQTWSKLVIFELGGLGQIWLRALSLTWFLILQSIHPH